MSTKLKHKLNSLADLIEKVFCPTGPGGGVDNSCGRGGKRLQFNGDVLIDAKPDAARMLRKYGYEPKDLALAVGAPDGSEVTIHKTVDNGFYVETSHDDIGLFSERKFFFKNGKPDYVANQSIEIYPEMGKGIGTRIFAEQVENCAALGFGKIVCEAAGASGMKQNGYYTWPRLGYDGNFRNINIPLEGMPKNIQKARTISDVFKTEAGRVWWKENGWDFNAEFDLSENSRSRNVLNKYLKQKGLK